MSVIIAIDGPSASGKSTVSREVARRLKFTHVDSGSLYRGVTWYFLAHNVSVPVGAGLAQPAKPEAIRALTIRRRQGYGGQGKAPAKDNFRKQSPSPGNLAVTTALRQMRLDVWAKDNTIKYSIDGIEPEAELRSQAVNEKVSPVAALPAVRRWVVRQLRGLVSFGDLVVEGRDIGTAVFPDAQFKFYLDAAPEERARRRHLELKKAGVKIEYDEVLRSILRRDGIDSTRKMAPLKVAGDALVIQTTKMSIKEVVNFIVDRVKNPDMGISGR